MNLTSALAVLSVFLSAQSEQINLMIDAQDGGEMISQTLQEKE